MLICPGCQAARDWADALDRCSGCGSAALVCRLGEVECRDCGHTRDAAPGDLVHSGAPPGGSGDGDLSEEVAAALNRVLRRGPAL
ncbi:MAG TPA: hypothetical protein VKY91_20780 [Vulgatibacteraceae bacterium]|nr:hypothetical protein [Vulgatibacteraceae bacterium]